MPIHKRVESEMEKRKVKLQNLTNQVTQERELKKKLESDELYFPRTQLSYEIQRVHYQYDNENQDLQFVDSRLSCHEMFKNFMRDHKAWEFRRDEKIKKKIEEKEYKIQQNLTFRPKINEKTNELLPKRTGKIENRLIRQGLKTGEKLKQIYDSNVFPFTPNIYQKGHNRSHSLLNINQKTSPFLK